MKFNKFAWNNYLETESGKSSVEFFASFESKHKKHDKKLIEFMSDWSTRGMLDFSNTTKKDVENILLYIDEIKDSEKEGLIPKKILNRNDAEKYFYDLGQVVIENEDNNEESALFELDSISNLSVALYCLYPQYFFPYYFYPNFYAIKMIFDEFGIFLPPVPPKKDYDKRFYYYYELCKSLYDFWDRLGFKSEHLPTFLYHYAPEFLNLKKIENVKLPKANRAFFVGGGINNNGDFNYLDKVSSKSECFWQGNKDTEIGDIIVMYCLAPRSHVHSIWRAIRPGGIEPFRGYYNTIWIGYPQLIKPIHLSELKEDKILSQFPLVKGNMQGINGRQIPKEYYDRLLELIGKKGTEIKMLPKLENKELKGVKLKNERDVEVHILEPLLEDLDFSTRDWERQVSIRSGRSERIIPDYLINVSKDREHKTVKADFVWEAKYSIENKDQLKRDFGQVRSYAMLVDARGIGLVSKEGVWICAKTNDFHLKNAIHWSATKLRESDSLAEIRSSAGKKALKK